LVINRFWTEADQPWLFLAACLEWKRYKEEGPGMISHLPISMDGSSNGYQHLSAMRLDPIGVHACDVDLLNRVLREEFDGIYSEPVLQNFLEQQRKAHPGISLPDPPQTGDLDIQQVLWSPYFFA